MELTPEEFARAMSPENRARVRQLVATLRADVAEQVALEMRLLGHPIEDADQEAFLAELAKLDVLYRD